MMAAVSFTFESKLKKFVPISICTFQSAGDFTRKTVQIVPEESFDVFLYLVSPKNKELVAFTGV